MKRVDYFDCIDTKEKAYILGFICGDGHINKQAQAIEVSVAMADKEVVQFIADSIEIPYKLDYKKNIQKRIFPKAKVIIYSKQINTAALKMYGGRLKDDRSLPRVKKSLVKYMVLGLFDAEGCITWGYRKDRGRLWQKVSFTSKFKILESAQNILLNHGISTKITPKKGRDCHVLNFCNELDVLTFFEYLPKDLVVLKRKNINYLDWIKAVKDKYEVLKGDEVAAVDARTLKKYNIDYYPAEFEGFAKVVSVNKDIALLDNDLSVRLSHLRKSGNSNYALRLKLDEIGEKYG